MGGEMSRLPDWQARLMRYILDNRTRTLDPGQWDCMLFGAGAVEAMTGIDYAADYRGHYSSFNSGFKLLKKAGWASHTDMIDSLFARVDRAAARPGDIASALGNDGSSAIGVVQGAMIYMLASGGGYRLVPLSEAGAVWSVG